MDSNISEILNLFFRWIHVIAGITWIGILYFFNWINGPFAATLDADSKKKVIPELMPRALYWFRWGAAFTWLSGILLLGIIYYMGGALVPPETGMSVGAGTGIGLGLLVVAWVVYDTMWKAMAKSESAAVFISFALAVGVAFGLTQVFSGRAMFIHVGAMFGTLMAANVWMRIWPAQRRIIKATAEGNKPDAGDGAMAKLRSKHNTYMSVPLVFTMISNHFPISYGHDKNWIMLGVFIAAGFLFVKICYTKGASAAPTKY